MAINSKNLETSESVITKSLNYLNPLPLKRESEPSGSLALLYRLIYA